MAVAGGNFIPDTWRKGRKRQAGKNVISSAELTIGKDRFDIGGRSGDRDQARIVELLLEIMSEVRVGVDGDQGRIRPEAIEHRFGEVPTPGPYSTNSRVFAQSTGSSIRSIRTRLDGMIEPTITGFQQSTMYFAIGDFWNGGRGDAGAGGGFSAIVRKKWA